MLVWGIELYLKTAFRSAHFQYFLENQRWNGLQRVDRFMVIEPCGAIGTVPKAYAEQVIGTERLVLISDKLGI